MFEEEQKQKRKEQQKERREALKQAGICVVCGKQPAISGLVHCQKCRDKNKERLKEIRKKRKRQGVCILCNEPALRGSVFCKEHKKRGDTSLPK